MKIKDRIFENYTFVMAIINLTPDSFYSPSRVDVDSVLYASERAIKAGAAILDLGVQSTRPGYSEVSPDEEIERLTKPLELVRKNFDVPISVDTYFSKTARAALSLGCDMINDIWGLQRDRDMPEVIAKSNASVCIMHNSKTPTSELWSEIDNFFKRSLDLAKTAGIDRDKICLDGGIGFAKTIEQNWELLNSYERLQSFNLPLLLGTSRKSMFGGRVEDRLEPTIKSTILAAKKGVLFVRVHDVAENVEAIKKVYGG